MRKTVVHQQYSCSVQKTAGKNTQYSRNETILKIGHLAKAIALANWSLEDGRFSKSSHFSNILVLFPAVFCKEQL